MVSIFKWVNPTSRVPDRFKWVSFFGCVIDFLNWSITIAYLCCVLKDIDRARNWVLGYIDQQGFDNKVFLVAASGFLTDSYALFATNVILPSLAYIYWPDATDNHPELAINCVTLAGSACGQAIFGYLADRYGRRKLYGVELVIVIFGTLGMAQVSTGTNQSMSIIWWIVFWRFFMGLGIGAEYPLSAVITAEFASTKYRATMMACVFLMQPLGQILAVAVGWGVLTSLVHSRNLDTLSIRGADLTPQQKFDILSVIDSVWRCVVAVGTFPALLAILFRLSIPESPFYTLDVLKYGIGAFYDIRVHHRLETTEENAMQEIGGEVPAEDPPADVTLAANFPTVDPIAAGLPGEDRFAQDPFAQGPVNSDQSTHQRGQDEAPNYFTWQELHQYFIEEKNWLWLLATSTCWFLLDFAFYGLGIDNPRRIAAIWAPSYPNQTDFEYNIFNWPSNSQVGNSTTVYSNATVPDWENPFDVETNIYQELFGNARRYVITISIGSLLGSLAMILLINKLPRKGWLIISFLILAVFFIAMGATLKVMEFSPSHPGTIVFYIICQFFFNFGPNTLTFIIPAEIFPTRYRCTCHGISAAFGKLGSLAVQGVLSRPEFSADPARLGIVLGCFAIPMTLGAAVAWGWLPTLQEAPTATTRTCHPPTLPSKTLDTLARGRSYATGPEDHYPPGHERAGRLRGGGEALTFVAKLGKCKKALGRWWNGGYEPRKDAERERDKGWGDMEMEVPPPARMRGPGAEGHSTAINRGDYFRP